MLPQHPAGSSASPAVPGKSGSLTLTRAQSFEAIKARVLTKLEDRMDPASSKRMPPSLLRQSLRTYAEQIAEQEGCRLAKPDRERVVEEVLAELLGYGPLGELFLDPTVCEVMVTGPHAVIVRRERESWLPTSLHFRDEAHLRSALDRLATHADPVGGMTASVNLFDLNLPNGFRGVGVIPPEALGQPATAAFIRVETAPEPLAAPVGPPPSGRYPGLAATGAASAASAPPAHGSASAATDRTANPAVPIPPAPSGPSDPTPSGEIRDPLMRYRLRIMEALIAKLARHGVYDVQRVEITEFRKIVATFIAEFCEMENFYLSDTDQGRLLLEILTAMHR